MNRGGIRKDHALQRTHVESALVVANSADDPADFFRPQFPAVTQSGDSVYLGTIANRLYRLAADTGAVVAEYPLDARPLGSITIGDDSILVPVGPQLVRCLTSDLKTERWRKQASQ